MEKISPFLLQDPLRNLQNVEGSQPSGFMIQDLQYIASMTGLSSIPLRTRTLEPHLQLPTTSKWQLKQLAAFYFRFVTNMVGEKQLIWANNVE